MGLSYKEKRTVEEEKELTVPTDWGMFTSKGNKRLTEIAEEAYERVEELCANSRFNRPSKQDVRRELVRMLTKWVRLWDTKTYPESSDTAVRERVGSFMERLALASRAFDKYDCYDLWEEVYSEARSNVYD